MKPPIPGVPTPDQLDSYYLAFLYPGIHYNPMPPDTPAEIALFREHVGWVMRSQQPGGPAIVGGPVLNPPGDVPDQPMPIGMSVLRASSPEEALAIAKDDPGVQAGHYRIVVREWLVPKGTLK